MKDQIQKSRIKLGLYLSEDVSRPADYVEWLDIIKANKLIEPIYSWVPTTLLQGMSID